MQDRRTPADIFSSFNKGVRHGNESRVAAEAADDRQADRQTVDGKSGPRSFRQIGSTGSATAAVKRRRPGPEDADYCEDRDTQALLEGDGAAQGAQRAGITRKPRHKTEAVDRRYNHHRKEQQDL